MKPTIYYKHETLRDDNDIIYFETMEDMKKELERLRKEIKILKLEKEREIF